MARSTTNPLFSLLVKSFQGFDVNGIPTHHGLPGFRSDDERRTRGRPGLDNEQLSDPPAIPGNETCHSLSQTGAKPRADKDKIRSLRTLECNHGRTR